MTAAAERFSPKLGVLPPQQRRLWDELTAIPDWFTLYGGTAIALQLGHRESVDFDFFGRENFEPRALLKRLPFLADGEVTQSAASTLSVWLDRGGAARVSFFGVPELGEVESPRIAEGPGIKVAALIDLAALKTVVVQSRAEVKDFIDIDALLSAGIDLSDALAAAKIIQGPSFNPQISLKALAYFGDGNLASLSRDARKRLLVAVDAVDLNCLPTLRYNRRYGATGP